MKEYTAEELGQNYEKFLGAIKGVFSGDRLERLLHMYSEDELGEELAIAPASGVAHYHSAYTGGYIDHVLRVCKNSLALLNVYTDDTGVEPDFTKEELLFAAFHHDLGKLGTKRTPHYIPETSEWHRKNQNKLYNINGENHHMDVTHRALWLLNQYGIKYTEKEMLGIMLADGLYNEATKPYFITYREEMRLKTDLPYVLHWADHMSCRQENFHYYQSKK